MATADRVLQVVKHLEQQILSGKFAPGDLLPPERTISDQLGVSRSVVREALGRLASVGLVKSHQGSGTRAAAPSASTLTAGYERMLKVGAFSLADLTTVRKPLECAIARLAAVNRTEEHLRELEKHQKVLGNPRRSSESHIEADVGFHSVLAEASGNPIFNIVLAPIQELLIESRRRTMVRDGAGVAFTHHQRILDAVMRGDSAEAEQAMSDHMAHVTSGPDAPVELPPVEPHSSGSHSTEPRSVEVVSPEEPPAEETGG